MLMRAQPAAALKAILFDMDGTLADTEELHRRSFNAAFAEARVDLEWSPDRYHDLLAISGGRERILRCLEERGVAAPDGATLPQLTASLHRRKSEIYRGLLTGAHVGLRPGVRRLIDEAAASGVRMAIATSSSRRNVETLLASTLGAGSIGLFDAIVTGDEVAEKKPSPAVYRRALADIGEDARDCVAIEDARNGNLAALAAGLTTVITTHAFTRDNDFSGAALVLDHLGEPGHPFRVLAGDAHGVAYVDLALLRRLLSGNRGQTGISSTRSNFSSS